MSYRNLQNFHEPPPATQVQGVPRYGGLEYDYEVSGGNVVSSPGGVSSTHHHWTKGFYGSGGVTPDIYGGQGDRYKYGALGNIYTPGYDAATEMGNYQRPPDFMPSVNETRPINDIDPQRDNFEVIPATSPPSSSPLSETTPIPENFTAALAPLTPSETSFKINIHPVTLFIILIIAYITLQYWGKAMETLLEQKVFGGRNLSMKNLFIVAIFFSVILIGLVWWLHIRANKVV